MFPPENGIASLHQLPAPPADFTGREEELKALLSAAQKGGAVISGVHGMGGIGKTALALKAAEQLAPRYPEAQFFVDLRGAADQQPLAPSDAMAQIIRACYPTEKLPLTESEVQGLYRSILHGKKALLVFDNAREKGQIEALIPPPGCMMLVTSRQRFTLPGLYSLYLDKMKEEDAQALILRISPRVGELASEVAELCGYLPLALRVVASALLVNQNLSPKIYVHKLEDTQQRLKLTDVEISLGFSYNLLTPQQQLRWRMLAVFPGSFELAGAAAVWDEAIETAQEALSELCAFSMVEFSAEAASAEAASPEAASAEAACAETAAETARYSLHDLMHLFAGKKLNEQDRLKARQRHAVYYANVLAAAVAYARSGEKRAQAGLKLFDLEWENIQAGQVWAAENMRSARLAAELCFEYAFHGMQSLDPRQKPQDLIQWNEAALQAALLTGDRWREGRALSGLGVAYLNAGYARKAAEFYQQALAIDQQTGNRQNEASDLSNLGTAYYNLGDAYRATEFYLQALSMWRELGERAGEGVALSGLGLAYLDMGDAPRAIEFYELALSIFRESGDRRSEGIDLGNLANAYSRLGDTRRAIEIYGQALALAREIGDRRGEGIDLGNLANAYYKLGNERQAITFYEEALEIARETGDHLSEGIDLDNLGAVYSNLGEVGKAISCYEQALATRREVSDRKGEGIDLEKLANAASRLGDMERAIELYGQALAIHRELGDRHAEGTNLSNLGMVYADAGKPEMASECFEQALAIYRESGDQRGEGLALAGLERAQSKPGFQ